MDGEEEDFLLDEDVAADCFEGVDFSAPGDAVQPAKRRRKSRGPSGKSQEHAAVEAAFSSVGLDGILDLNDAACPPEGSGFSLQGAGEHADVDLYSEYSKTAKGAFSALYSPQAHALQYYHCKVPTHILLHRGNSAV